MFINSSFPSVYCCLLSEFSVLLPTDYNRGRSRILLIAPGATSFHPNDFIVLGRVPTRLRINLSAEIPRPLQGMSKHLRADWALVHSVAAD